MILGSFYSGAGKCCCILSAEAPYARHWDSRVKKKYSSAIEQFGGRNGSTCKYIPFRPAVAVWITKELLPPRIFRPTMRRISSRLGYSLPAPTACTAGPEIL